MHKAYGEDVFQFSLLAAAVNEAAELAAEVERLRAQLAQDDHRSAVARFRGAKTYAGGHASRTGREYRRGA